MLNFRKRQITILNQIIAEKEESVTALQSEEQRMTKRIEQIKEKYGLLDTYDNLKEEIKSLEVAIKDLEDDIKVKKDELDILTQKLELAKELEEIEELRLKLQQEKDLLETFKSSMIKTKDIIFGVYSQNADIEEDYVGKYIVNIFVLVDTLHFDDDYDYEDALVYQSLGKDLTAMMTTDLNEAIFDDDYDTEDYITNTSIDLVLTFSEVCMMIDSAKYLDGCITPIDADNILKEFLSMYTVKEDEDQNIKIVKKIKRKRTRQK